MCGVAQKPGSDSELVVPPPTAMPPSITVGSDPNKGSPPSGDAPRQPPHNSPSNDKTVPTIDLASEADGDDDLRKAIALSLQDQKQEVPVVPGVSAEDQEVSRALEASLKESRPQATIDNINPQDRKRVPYIPVGLKNIGNSCWFNVVIQMMLHIPLFRNLVLGYEPVTNKSIQNENTKEREPNIVLLLRPLFALLIASGRKYVDPTKVVNVFQDQEMRKDAQQDVCEFIHKLLDRLENEFQKLIQQTGIEKESSECHISKDYDFNNPIKKLFYGQSCNEINEEGSSKHITFGQYLLHVMNYKNIHESILASMTQNMPDTTKESVLPVQQETWFKLLPPVLIFSLSRYEYSKEKKRAEKVHNKFEFPQYLYMDRYMECNKRFIKEKHIKVAKLQEDLNSLVRTLDRYLKFGSGEGKYPLSDILKYTLEFAETNLNIDSEEPSTSVPSPSKMEIDSVENCESTDVEMGEELDIKKDEPYSETSLIKAEDIKAESSQVNLTEESPVRIPSPSKKMRVMPPTPGSMNATDLSVLQNCLSRWQHEVEQQVEELQRDICNLEEQLNKMYDDPCLQKIPYKLHGVVVHEGQASGGHYWVYIYNRNNDVWMKFNDIQVCESKWEEVLQDSIGGQNNASAYCLMYIDECRAKTLFPNPTQSLGSVISDMPIDLQEFVKTDNLKFCRELEEWVKKKEMGEEWEKKKELQKQSYATCAPHPGIDNALVTSDSRHVVTVDEDDVNFFISVETMISHAAQTLLEKVSNNQEATNTKLLDTFLNNELTRQKGFTEKDMDNETYLGACLLDLGIYMLKNGLVSDMLVKWYCCEVMWQKIHQFKLNPKIEQIKAETQKYLTTIHEQYSKENGSLYKAWKSHYRNFIKCTWYFVHGYLLYRNNKYEKSLYCIQMALLLNRHLKVTDPPGDYKCLDESILLKCRRMCLLDFNSKLIEEFVNAKTDKQRKEVCEIVTTFIVPGLIQLDENNCPEDSSLAAGIREDWCTLIDEQSNWLQHILKVVLSSDQKQTLREESIRMPRLPGILSLYKQFVDTCIGVLAVSEKTTKMSEL